jgi:NADPH:quinone reductase-like Zn-dependent oxidoreductase
MRAALCERYGPPEVVLVKDVPKPSPADDQALIRIVATTVSSGDWRVRSASVPRGFGLIMRLALGWSGPRQPILGTELSGVIETVGRDVKELRPGDEVIAFPGAAMGCHAEYVCVRQDGPIARKPPSLTHEEAATLCFGGMTALDFLRRAKLQPGEKVLVNGASGAVGTATVQLATRHFGAEVTSVCSGGNAELVQSLGAAHVIDYTREDFARSGQRYDVIVDTAGTAPYARSRGSLKEGGRLCLVLAGLPDMLPAPWVALTTSHRIVAGPASERAQDVKLLAELAQAGVLKPVIDRRYRFEQIVEAHRYVDTGHKRGSVVVTLGAS